MLNNEELDRKFDELLQEMDKTQQQLAKMRETLIGKRVRVEGVIDYINSNKMTVKVRINDTCVELPLSQVKVIDRTIYYKEVHKLLREGYSKVEIAKKFNKTEGFIDEVLKEQQ